MERAEIEEDGDEGALTYMRDDDNGGEAESVCGEDEREDRLWEEADRALTQGIRLLPLPLCSK